MTTKAIFFDRDDTLIHDSNYMHKIEDLDFIDGTFNALQTLQDHGYLLFIVTNQSGIGRGYFNEADMHTFNNHMLAKLLENKIKITEVVFCPHAPEDKCSCRKPESKLIDELCEKYQIDRPNSYMIGDKDSDIEAGKRAKLKTIKVTKEKSLKDFIDTIIN